MADQKTILSTKALSIGYKNGHEEDALFSNLDLEAKEGTLISLLGENGIGKSTLLRTLSGLQLPLSGEIFIGGQNLKNLNKSALAKVLSLVLTQAPSGLNFTVEELVSLGRFPYTSWTGRLQSEDKKKVNDALEICEITHFKHKNIYQISDGQFQKTLIARALAQDCPLMVLDEPTVHLDANNRYMIINLLKKIAKEDNRTIIMSTHQISMAAELSDEIWLAKQKNNLIVNTPEKLLQNNILQETFPFVKY